MIKMEYIVGVCREYGPFGIMAGALFWQVVCLQKRLVDVIESNTKAMTRLVMLIERKVGGESE